jgi:hypothetical protein
VIAPRAMFAGPGAARALATTRTGFVEFTFTGGAYLRFGPDWVMVSDRAEPFGPLSLVVSGVRRDVLSVGTRVNVTGAWLVLDDLAVSLERVRGRPAPLVPGPGWEAGREVISATVRTTLALLPEAPSVLQEGIDALRSGRIGDGVRALAGRGEGLTPAGDDILAGAAAARASRWRERADRAAPPRAAMSTLAAGRASPLGLAYLRCAERGELPDAGARLLSAIRHGSGPGAWEALACIRHWGASSGIALAWGICAAVGEEVDARSPMADDDGAP